MTKLVGDIANFSFTQEMIDSLPAAGEPAFIGVDLETTGFAPENEHILSVALLLIDRDFEILGEGIELVVHQPETVLDAMDEWCTKTHGESGLTDQVRKSKSSLDMVDLLCEQYLKETIGQLSGDVKPLPMFGNTIYLDRRFIEYYMPRLFNCFHYRNIDVSSFKEVAKLLLPELYFSTEKETGHTAMADIVESVEEMQLYRDHFLVKSAFKL